MAESAKEMERVSRVAFVVRTLGCLDVVEELLVEIEARLPLGALLRRSWR